MATLKVYEAKGVKYAFKNINKTTILGKQKVKLSDALSDKDIMDDLIALGYGGLITGDAAEKAVRNFNEALPKEEVEVKTASDVIAAIDAAKTVEEVNELVDGDDRKTVIKAADSKIKLLEKAE